MKPSAQLREQRQLTRKVHEVEREVELAKVRHWTKAEIAAKWPGGKYDTSTVRRDAFVAAILPKVRKWHHHA